MSANITDGELILLVDEVDRDFFLKGYHARRRQLAVAAEVCSRLGCVFQIGAIRGSFSQRVIEAHRLFYRKRDIGAPSVHSGVAAHLDIFFRVDFPLYFGSVTLNPFEHLDATEFQLKRLNLVSADLGEVLRCIVDVYDVGALLAPIHGYKPPEGDSGAYLRMAALSMQAATATLTQNFALRGSVLTALTSAELAIKSALFSCGKDEQWIREKIGHRLSRAKPTLLNFFTSECDNVFGAVDRLPDYVQSRYDKTEIGRYRTFEIVRDCQFILACVARGHSGVSFRDKLINHSETA